MGRGAVASDTEASILRVAARLFRQRGYHGTSMQDIAGALGLQRGSLYHHIESKEDLLFKIMEGGVGRLIAAVEPVVTSDLGPAEKLEALIVAHVRCITRSLDNLTVFLTELRSLSPERLRAIVARRDRYEALVRRVIQEGIAAGTFSPELDVRFSGIAVLAVCNWLYQWYRSDGPQGPEEIGRAFARLLLRGMLRR